MKANLTELVFILDQSGSMSGLEKDTIGGYNSLIEKQKKEAGEALVSTILFNQHVKAIHDRVNLNQIEKLTDKEYSPSGMTALLDALGSSIQHIQSVHKNLKEEELPSKTLFVITTDGLENSSKEYSYDKVKSLIEEAKKKGWEFLFLGANIDAAKEASRFGIPKEHAVNFKCDSKGVELNYLALDRAICRVRNSQSLDDSWRELIDEDYQDRK